MKILPFGFAIPVLAAASIACAQSTSSKSDVIAVRGAKIYAVNGVPIERGVLLIRGGKIDAVGPESALAIPDGARVIDETGKVIIPGIVDSHSHIGIGSRPAVPANEDVNEGTGPIQPGLRAIDAIYPADPGIRMALAGGITTANIMPGSGNVIGGQTAYIKLRGKTIEEMLIPGTVGGLKMANGENPKHYGRENQAPMTRMEVAALARKEFIKAQEYRRKWDEYKSKLSAGNKDSQPPERDLELEPLVEVLEGRRIVHHHTHRADDIMTVLRLADEFHFRVVIHHGTESYKIADQLARRNIPVTLTITDSPGGKLEATQVDLEAAAILDKAGVKVAVNTDDSVNSSRFLLREAALTIRGGLSEEAALRALTINAAGMLDLQNRVGSLEHGKDADFVVLSGNPFSVYTKVLETWIEGEKLFDRLRPEDLRYATGGFQVGDRYPMLRQAARGGGR